MADELLESLDGVPEFLHGQFAKVEVDGAERYKYQPPDSKTAQDVAKLDGALKKERERAKQLAEQLQARTSKIVLGDEELDPDEVKAAIEAHRKTQGEQMVSLAEADKRAEERITKARAAAQKDVEELKAQIAEREKQLDEALVDTGIASAATNSESPVRFKDVDDVKAFIHRHNLARRNGAKIEFYDLDGNPLTNAKGDAGNWFDLMALVAAKKPHYVVESQGTGSQPPLNGSTPRKKKSDMSMDEKIDFITKYGEDKYAALPA